MADDPRQLTDILRTLSDEQLRFVAQRLSVRKDSEAAALCGIPIQVVYNWDNKQDINEAVHLARLDGVNVARERLKRLSDRAIDALGDAIADGGGRYSKRVEAAIAVLDRAGIVPVQKVEQKTETSGEVVIRVEYADDVDRQNTPATRGAGADQT